MAVPNPTEVLEIGTRGSFRVTAINLHSRLILLEIGVNDRGSTQVLQLRVPLDGVFEPPRQYQSTVVRAISPDRNPDGSHAVAHPPPRNQ